MNGQPDTATATLATPQGPVALTAGPTALLRIELGRERPARGSSPVLEEAVARLRDYFAGRRPTFNLPLAFNGATDFNRRVWTATQAIPPGATCTYGQLARAINAPRAARAVGNALGRNPLPVVIPCHRVVAAHAPGGFGSGLAWKAFLLRCDGIDVEWSP